MTADPKAPGAPAVFLYREESVDNFNHVVSVYARIKLLTEEGREWATVRVRYAPGYQGKPTIEGRTIHPDGSVVPLRDIQDNELSFFQGASKVHEVVFTLPDLTPGSILEYRWTRGITGIDFHSAERLGKAAQDEFRSGLGSSLLAYEIPDWEVQQRIYVHKARFYYNPFGDLERNVIGNPFTYFVNDERASYCLFTERLPNGAHVTKSPKNDFTLELTDVPALQHEPDAPPEESLRYRVRFYFSPYITEADYWSSEQKRWSKRLDAAANPSPAVIEAATQITSGVQDPEAKARKLYEAVQALELVDLDRPTYSAGNVLFGTFKKPGDVWTQKSGTRFEIALLYLALARAANLNAHGLQVADRSVRLFDPNYLTLDQLQSLLVVLRFDDRKVYLDPGEKICPFGLLRWGHTMTGGLEQDSAALAYTPPNNPKDAITGHTADLTLDPQGAASGTVKVLMNGPEALRWRQLNLTAGAVEVQRQLTAELQQILPRGLTAEVTTVQGLDTSAGFLSVTGKVSGQLATSTGNRLTVPAFFFSTRAHPAFLQLETRVTPVDLHFEEQVIDDVVYHLPPGFTIEAAPQPVQLPWPEHAALVVKTQPGQGTIDIKHIFARAFVFVDPKEYPALRDYYQKIATADQQQLVLAQGN